MEFLLATKVDVNAVDYVSITIFFFSPMLIEKLSSLCRQ